MANRLLIVLLLVLNIITGCASTNNQNIISYNLTIDEPQRIRFSGKGAGAGMMLSSSMGPMGIAVGVAIDEGIAKDIHEAFTAKGHSLESLVDAAVDEAGAGYYSDNQGASQQPLVIHLRRVGIKMAGGERVVADLEGEISMGGAVHQLKEISSGDVEEVPPVTLDQVKLNGDLTYTLLKDALVRSIKSGLGQ